MTDFDFDEPRKTGTNQAAPPSRCRTCGGDRYVMVRLRTARQSLWMNERHLAPSARSRYEEMAPCPDCNAIEVTYYRHGTTMFRSMDAAAAREALNSKS